MAGVKSCPAAGCFAVNPNGRKFCIECGHRFYIRNRMTFGEAVKLLMTLARPGDPRIIEAWRVCYTKVYGYDPIKQDYIDAGLPPP